MANLELGLGARRVAAAKARGKLDKAASALTKVELRLEKVGRMLAMLVKCEGGRRVCRQAFVRVAIDGFNFISLSSRKQDTNGDYEYVFSACSSPMPIRPAYSFPCVRCVRTKRAKWTRVAAAAKMEILET